MYSACLKFAAIPIVLFATIFSLNAQNVRVDSIKNKLSDCSGRDSVILLIDLAREYSAFDDKIALSTTKLAHTLAYKESDTLYMVKSKRMIGQLLRRLNDLDSSLFFLRQALMMAEEFRVDEEILSILNALGNSYTYRANYDDGLTYYFRLLDMSEKRKDFSTLTMCLSNIGLVYYKLKDYNSALDYYERCFEIKKHIQDNYYLDRLLINLGLCYINVGKLNEAKKRILAARHACGGKCSEAILMEYLFALGRISESVLDKESLSYFFKSYSLALKLNDVRYIIDNTILISRIYRRKGNLLASKRFLNATEKILPESSHNLEMLKLYREFSMVYKALRDTSNLALAQEKYIILRDTVYNGDRISSLAKINAQFLERERESLIAIQAEQGKLKNSIAGKQYTINLLIMVLMALSCITGFVLYRINQKEMLAAQRLNDRIMHRTKSLSLNNEALNELIMKRSIDSGAFISQATKSLEEIDNLCVSPCTYEVSIVARKLLSELERTNVPDAKKSYVWRQY